MDTVTRVIETVIFEDVIYIDIVIQIDVIFSGNCRKTRKSGLRMRTTCGTRSGWNPPQSERRRLLGLDRHNVGNDFPAAWRRQFGRKNRCLD